MEIIYCGLGMALYDLLSNFMIAAIRSRLDPVIEIIFKIDVIINPVIKRNPRYIDKQKKLANFNLR